MDILKLKEQMKLIGEDILNIKNIENPYEEVCLEVVEKDGELIQYIPQEMQTYDICLAALKNNNYAAKYISEDKCLEIIEKNGMAIKYIPKELQTEKMCVLAVNQWGLVIKYISDEMKTEEVVMLALNHFLTALEFVPDDKKTYKLCVESIKKSGATIKYIPEEMKTEEMCILAVKSSGGAIKYISKEKQTEKVCIESVKAHDLSISGIKNRTPRVCFYAFLRNYEHIEKKYIEDGLKAFLKMNLKLENMVFYNYKSFSFKNGVYKPTIGELFDENKYELIDCDLRSIEYLKEYLIYENSENHFVLDSDAKLSFLGEIGKSNNELIIVDTDNINNVHKMIANRII